MDLKGSLIDTNLRIYPSSRLIEFVKTIPPSDQLPHNVLQIIKSNPKSTFKTYKLEDVKPVQLNNSDFDNLKIIREKFDKIHKDDSVEGFVRETLLETETEQNKEDVDNEKPLKGNLEMKDDIKQNKSERKDNDKNETEENNDNQKSSKECLNSNDNECPNARPFLVTSDVDWLYVHIKNRKSCGEKDIPYLHTLLEGSSVEVPDNQTIKRNPVLEARCVKLRAQQEAREYRKMTKGVDNVRMRFPEDSISYQLKQLNRHLIAIGQFIISIFAGFLFGFRGVEWMVGNLDFGFRLLLGVMCALVIALAEIYFLAKKLNEELCIPETVQLGGPVKFADQDSYNYKHDETTSKKPHQD